jgi:hypothetical protein
VTEKAVLLAAARSVKERDSWRWPLDLAGYDHAPALTLDEVTALTVLAPDKYGWRLGRGPEWMAVQRLVRPLADARAVVEIGSEGDDYIADRAVAELLIETREQRSSIWSWSQAT